MMFFFALLATLIIFYITVIVKGKTSQKWCAICVAVSLTWVGLLIGREFGWLTNDTLLALLMGESVVGGYYALDKKVKDELLIFRLPVLLTLTTVAYTTVTKTVHLLTLFLIGVLWIIHGGLYFYRSKSSVKSKVDKLIACCSRW